MLSIFVSKNGYLMWGIFWNLIFSRSLIPTMKNTCFYLKHRIDEVIKERINHVEHLYIHHSDLIAYENFISAAVQAVAENPHISITKKAAVLYHGASVVVDELFEDPEALENVPKSKKVVNTFVSTIFSDARAIESLMKIASYDYYTQTHSINVCVYSLSLGSYLKLGDKMLEDLGMAALLHDLGKSKVDSAIVNKKGHLTMAEFEKMKSHPNYGYEIATKIGVKNTQVLDGIRHHHEKLDGSGYPDGLKGREIALFARIIGVCDVFDALSTSALMKIV
jgi:HD-GYP domain-containing protein (c-di-GMP phosphodiesterase class II)